MLFSGKKVCFFVFFGGSGDEIEVDRDYRDYRGYSLAFLFLQARAQASPKGHCFFAAFSFVSFPSRLRPVSVLLPSFYRLFTVFVSRLIAVGIKQGDFKKKHRNCYV